MVLEKAPKHMLEYIILIAWRLWYGHNEVTHFKPLPALEGSKRFLIGYIKILRNLKDLTTEETVKGKQPIISSLIPEPGELQIKELSDKLWTKPPAGWVKLNCEGSVKVENGTAGAGMVLRAADRATE
jgi:hypothetical protein